MTGLLKDLMSDKASHAGAPHLDLDAIIETGDKRVRRRRIVTGAGVAAVAAVVIAAFAVVPGVVDSSGPDPTDPPVTADFSADLLTYAQGTTIHYGAQTIDVAPLEVKALVRTDAGFVFSAADKKVYFTADGSITRLDGTVGPSAETPALVATGPYAAWVDLSADAPELVVYDTAEESEVLRSTGPELEGNPRDPFEQTAVLAMDGSQLYWHNLNGVVVTDLSAPQTTPIVLMPNASTQWLYDVRKGVLARASHDDVTVTVSRETDAVEPNFAGQYAILSPDASHVATTELGGSEWKVFDVGTGADLTPDRLTSRLSWFVQWTDENSYYIFSDSRESPILKLLVCTTIDRSCKTPTGPDANAYMDGFVRASGFYSQG